MIGAESENSWFVNFASSPDAKIRLFCFHYAGGSSNVFRQWHQYLPRQVQVVPVELPGHGSRLREPLIESLLPLVEKIGEAVKGRLEKPFAFFGHSMGALISFELTRWLRRNDHRLPELLFLAGHSAPDAPETHEPIHALPDEQFVAKLRALNGTSEEVLNNDELMQLMMPILRADFKVCETYECRPDAPLDRPFVVMGGANDRDVPEEHLRAWKKFTTGEFKLKIFPGDHFFIHSQQPLILQLVSFELSRVLSMLER